MSKRNTELQKMFWWGIITLFISELCIYLLVIVFTLKFNVDSLGNPVMGKVEVFRDAVPTMVVAAFIFILAWLIRGLERRQFSNLELGDMDISEHENWIIVHKRWILKKEGKGVIEYNIEADKLKKQLEDSQKKVKRS